MSSETLIEANAVVAALAVAAVIALVPSPGVALAPAPLALAVGWIVWSDARRFIIPDGAAAALAALALGTRLGVDGLSWQAALLALADGLACAAVLWAVREAYYRLRGHDGLGLGDVKLAAGAGILAGPTGFAIAVLAASLAGLAIAAMRGGMARTDKLPLGALLAPATFGVWALGLGHGPV